MLRGEVQSIDLMLPKPEDRSQLMLMEKLAVLLRNAPDNNPDAYVPFLLASTWRGRQVTAYEVLVPADRGFFTNDSVIDARWPFTMQVRDFKRGYFVLPKDIMTEVDLALVVGLQLSLV